jgi:cellulose synthase/poly-beta-1,6-N-acetylglucosamine synthase-like glycosyltransferase
MSSPWLKTGTVTGSGSTRSGLISRLHARGNPPGLLGLPVLPQPPTDAEKERYADRNTALLTRASLFSFGALVISQLRFVHTLWLLLAIFGPMLFFTILYYLVSLCVNFSTRGFDMDAHRVLVAWWRPRVYPSLDVFLPVCGEHPDVLRNTWVHVREMTRHYPGQAVAYVLDDGASSDVAAMAMEFGFTYVVRPSRGWYKKAGNLRYAFSRSAGDFILILDADFAPRADLPAEMLPYFYADPGLGIVQSPQYFRTHPGQSWMERGAAAVQELFYRLVQVSRDQHDGAVCVGSCAIYRRQALEVNGGPALIEQSEGVHTGFELRRLGWGLRYIPIPLATGLCPPDPDSFLSQQYRWCSGSMSLLASRKFWSTRMRWRTRFCYLSGFCYYMHTAVFTLVAPAIPLVLLIFMPDRVRLINYALIAPSIIYNVVVFPAWHRCRFGPSGYMAKALYGWAHLFCLWDICRGRLIGWQSAGDGNRKAGTRRIWLAVAAWNVPACCAWVVLSLVRMAQRGVADYAFILLAGLFASVVTAMVLASRRNYVRTAVREITG